MKSIIHAVVMASLAGAALAASPTSDDLRRCAAIADSNARLACFDQLSASAPPATSKKAPAAAPVAAAPAAAAAAPAAPVAAPAAASLGAEALPKTHDRAVNAAPTSLTAQVTGVLETQGNMFRITLDNGQVWQTQEGRSMFTVRVGDTVRIDRRSLGSYLISKMQNGKEGYSVRAIRHK
jgi:nucleoid-associated protein YgaU